MEGGQAQNQGMCLIEFVGCARSDLCAQTSVANKFSTYFKFGPRDVVHGNTNLSLKT